MKGEKMDQILISSIENVYSVNVISTYLCHFEMSFKFITSDVCSKTPCNAVAELSEYGGRTDIYPCSFLTNIPPLIKTYIKSLTLFKSLPQIMVRKIHTEEKSMFSVKPD